MAGQNRFFVNAYGPDSDAVKKALAWLAEEAKRRQLPAVIVILQKNQVDSLGGIIGDAQAKALGNRQTIKLNGVDLSLVTMRTLTHLTNKVALALWLPDRELSKVDDAQPAAMGIVPWAEGEGRQWIDSWNAVDMRTMMPAGGGPSLNRLLQKGYPEPRSSAA